MLVTDAGKLIRCPIHDVRIAGRRTQGVTIFRVADDERVVSVSHIPGDKLGEDMEEEGEGVEIVESLEGAEAPTVEKAELPQDTE